MSREKQEDRRAELSPNNAEAGERGDDHRAKRAGLPSSLSLRCPHCSTIYPNAVPGLRPGGQVVLRCWPSRKTSRLLDELSDPDWKRLIGTEPRVRPWCGKTFKLRKEREKKT